jgi:hypothetical protein
MQNESEQLFAQTQFRQLRNIGPNMVIQTI